MQAKELREIGKEELLQKEHELREELVRLRLRRGVSQVENPMRARQVRRDLARVLTVLRQSGNERNDR
ncbi:MAG: 50S ribosomal protein L29 [Candidatus Binatia bacterium]